MVSGEGDTFGTIMCEAITVMEVSFVSDSVTKSGLYSKRVADTLES